MPKYCDPQVLEHNWFMWLLTTATPLLEPYREMGLLWTKVLDFGVLERNPQNPFLIHALALSRPCYFTSYGGKIGRVVTVADTRSFVKLPTPDEITSLSESEWYKFDEDPFAQQDLVVPALRRAGFVRELTGQETWNSLFMDISRICSGVSTNIHTPDQQEQAHDAMAQIMLKIKTKKLIYTPAKGSIFGLLTTAIFRCMYSTLGKQSKYNHNSMKLAAAAMAGILPDNMHSLQVAAHDGPRMKSRP